MKYEAARACCFQRVNGHPNSYAEKHLLSFHKHGFHLTDSLWEIFLLVESSE